MPPVRHFSDFSVESLLLVVTDKDLMVLHVCSRPRSSQIMLEVDLSVLRNFISLPEHLLSTSEEFLHAQLLVGKE